MHSLAVCCKRFLGGRKSFFLLLIGFLTLSAAVFALLLIFPSVKEETKNPSIAKPVPSSIPTFKQDNNDAPRHLPKVYFTEYKNSAAAPALPEKINAYTFKTNYSLKEILELGRKLGLNQYKQDGEYVVLYNVSDKNKRGILSFHRPTGAFSFQSWTVTRAPTAATDPKIIALTFLSSLGVIDDTVTCPITYRRGGIGSMTFVECHRDWEKAGLPILGYPGILNVAEDEPLSALFVGETDKYAPANTSIVDVSTGQNGKVRPNGFGTATVILNQDGDVIAIESNLRKIRQKNVVAKQKLLSPQEALDRFLGHRAEQSLAIPSGSGYVDWNKVFPENTAKSGLAEITDYELAYLEKPGYAFQQRFVPYYLIRGNSRLQSGYRVRFVEILPAAKTADSSILGASTSAENAKSLKLGTFTPPPTKAVPTSSIPDGPASPTNPPQSGNPPPDQQSRCEFTSKAGPDVTIEVPGLGQMVLNHGSSGWHRTFYFKHASFPLETMTEIRDAFFKAVAEQYLINVAWWLRNDGADEAPRRASSALFQKINKFYLDRADKAEMRGIVEFRGKNLTLDFTDGRKKSETECGAGIIAPPVPDCNPRVEGYYDLENISKVYHSVLVSLNKLMGNDAELEAKAQLPDIFPTETFNASFAYIFSVYDERYLNTQPKSEVPCYISGTTPVLYLYPRTETYLSATLPNTTVYTDPPAKIFDADRIWNVRVAPDSKVRTERNARRPNLYYEYDRNKVSLAEPKEGFVVKYDKWEELVKDIGKRLGLNRKEIESLVIEVRNEIAGYGLQSTDYGFLKISLADRKELDKKLPVGILPVPDNFYRIHLLIYPRRRHQSLPQPKITPLPRNGFTAVELGARAD